MCQFPGSYARARSFSSPPKNSQIPAGICEFYAHLAYSDKTSLSRSGLRPQQATLRPFFAPKKGLECQYLPARSVGEEQYEKATGLSVINVARLLEFSGRSGKRCACWLDLSGEDWFYPSGRGGHKNSGNVATFSEFLGRRKKPILPAGKDARGRVILSAWADLCRRVGSGR